MSVKASIVRARAGRRLEAAALRAATDPGCLMVPATVLVALTVAAAFLAAPREAQALPLLAIVGIVALGGMALGAATDTLDDVLRSLCNFLLSGAQGFINSVTQSDLLTRDFDQLFPTVVGTVRNVHTTIAVPVALTVLTILFVFGFARAMSEMAEKETGMELWGIVKSLVAYSLLSSAIGASFDILMLMFRMAQHLIAGVLASGGAAASIYMAVPDSVENAGVLLGIAVAALVVWAVSAAVFLISQVVVILRAIQIYVWTAFSSLPLVFLVSDSSKSVAMSFLKHYVALLFSGAIMALLFLMYGAVMDSIALTAVSWTEDSDAVMFACELVASTASTVAFGWSVFKSGQWARDFVGVS